MRKRCVTAGGAARAPDELETREAETGMRNGRGEADLRAQRRDHEAMKDRASSMKRAPSERPLPHSLVHLDPAEPRCKLRTRCGAMRVPVCPVCVRNHTQTQTHIHIHIHTRTSHTKAGPAGGGVPAYRTCRY